MCVCVDRSYPGCLGIMATSCTQIVLSIMMLSALSLERYIKLVHPFFYARHVTERRVLLVISACVLYSAGFGALPLCGWNNVAARSASDEPYVCRFEFVLSGSYIGVMFLGHISPPFVLLPMMHLHVFITAHKLLRRRTSRRVFRSSLAATAALGRSQSEGALAGVTCGGGGAYSSPMTRGAAAAVAHTSRQRSLRHFKILVVMGLYFIVSWMPLCVWEIVLWHGFSKETVSIDDFLNPPSIMILYYVALILALANSAVNPVIFGAGNMTIRRTLERCLRRRKTAAAGDDELYRSFQSLTDVRLREMQYAIPVRPATSSAAHSPLHRRLMTRQRLSSDSPRNSAHRFNDGSHNKNNESALRTMSRSQSCPGSRQKYAPHQNGQYMAAAQENPSWT